MSFATITPTRGDRDKLASFCSHQLGRMELKPDHSYFIDYPPKNGAFDLVERVRTGIERATKDGHEYAFIIEDDDFYSPRYFNAFSKAMADGVDFLGTTETIYYNLANRTLQKFTHPGRSSLFCTGFKLSALQKFKWPKHDTVMLDLYLWGYSRMLKGSTKYFHNETIALGIKHGIGVCGGKGHTMKLKHTDQHHAFLKSHTDLGAFKFYESLI